MNSQIDTPGAGQLDGVDAVARERLASALGASKADNTKRAYRGAWSRWLSWCEAHGAGPARQSGARRRPPGRAQPNGGMPSLRMAVAAVASAHEIAGHANPCASPLVMTAMRGFVR